MRLSGLVSLEPLLSPGDPDVERALALGELASRGTLSNDDLGWVTGWVCARLVFRESTTTVTAAAWVGGLLGAAGLLTADTSVPNCGIVQPGARDRPAGSAHALLTRLALPRGLGTPSLSVALPAAHVLLALRDTPVPTLVRLGRLLADKGKVADAIAQHPMATTSFLQTLARALQRPSADKDTAKRQMLLATAALRSPLGCQDTSVRRAIWTALRDECVRQQLATVSAWEYRTLLTQYAVATHQDKFRDVFLQVHAWWPPATGLILEALTGILSTPPAGHPPDQIDRGQARIRGLLGALSAADLAPLLADERESQRLPALRALGFVGTGSDRVMDAASPEAGRLGRRRRSRGAR